MAAYRLAKGMDTGQAFAVQSQGMRKSPSFRADNDGCMCFVENEVRAVTATYRKDLSERRQVAVHGEDRLGNDKKVPLRGARTPDPAGSTPDSLQPPLKLSTIVVHKRKGLRKRKPDSIPDGSMAEAVIYNRVATPGNTAQHPQIGVIAGIEEQPGFRLVESGKRLLCLFSKRIITGQQPGTGTAMRKSPTRKRAPAPDQPASRSDRPTFDQPIGHNTQIIVGTKIRFTFRQPQLTESILPAAFV